MARQVILVAGPPCAGKSTYVAQRAKPGDLVLDQDAIGAQAMRQGLARVAAMTTGTAWVIRCCPGPQRRQAFARQIGATDVVLLAAPEAELIARAAKRPDPRCQIQAVRDWLRREAQDAPPREVPVAQAWRDLGGRRRTLARQVYARDRATPGYVCPVCGRPIDWTLPYRDPDTGLVDRASKSIDHAHELQDGGALTSLDNCWSVHLGCNSAKGAARRHEREREQRQPSVTVIAVDPHAV